MMFLILGIIVTFFGALFFFIGARIQWREAMWGSLAVLITGIFITAAALIYLY